MNFMELTVKKAERSLSQEINFGKELNPLTPILFGAAAFQCLNAGCELGLFELLNEKPGLNKKEIAQSLGLKDRAIDILLLGNTSLRLITTTSELYTSVGTTIKGDQKYFNHHLIDQVFAAGDWKIFKDIVAFEQYIVYLGQYDFTESLRTNSNEGLCRIPGKGRDLYHRLSENPHLENVFYNYMESWTKLSNKYLVQNIDFSKFRSLLDVGGGTAINAIDLAKIHPHLEVTVIEIPETALIAQEKVNQANLSERIKIYPCDMFNKDFPADHDCILFSHQLVIWTEDENILFLKRAYEALSDGGSVVIFSSMSNDNQDGPLMAALDSIYFAALPAEGGMIYSWNQYEQWLNAAGFKAIEKIPCNSWTPHGIIRAKKI